MHMGVDCDSRLAECHRDDDVRRLAAYAGQLQKLIQRRRHFTVVALTQLFADRMNRAGFHPVKRHWINRLLNDAHWRRQHLLRRAGDGKKPIACSVSSPVLCPQTQDTRDEDREWRLDIMADDRHRPLTNLLPHDANDVVDVVWTHRVIVQVTQRVTLSDKLRQSGPVLLHKLLILML